MKTKFILVAWILVAAITILAAPQSAFASCYISLDACPAHPEYRSGVAFLDPAQNVTGAISSKALCQKRAQDYHDWCLSNLNLSDRTFKNYSATYYDSAGRFAGSQTYITSCWVGTAPTGWVNYLNLTNDQCQRQGQVVANSAGAPATAASYEIKYTDLNASTYTWVLNKSAQYQPMADILVTGFAPWAGYDINLSGEIANKVGQLSKQAGVNIETRVLSVDNQSIDALVRELQARPKRPKIIVSMGILSDLSDDTINAEPFAIDYWGSRSSGSMWIPMPAPFLSLQGSARSLQSNSRIGDFMCDYIATQMLTKVTAENLNINSNGFFTFLHVPPSQWTTDQHVTAYANDVFDIISQIRNQFSAQMGGIRVVAPNKNLQKIATARELASYAGSSGGAEGGPQ